MLTVGKVDAGRAQNYYDKSKEEREEYYTKHMSSHDRWYGNLAKAMGLEGEMTPDEFHKLAEHQRERQGKNPKFENHFVDFTFSCPKAVSLLSCHPDYRGEIDDALEATMGIVADTLQNGDWLQVIVDGKAIPCTAAIMAGFQHEVARPTELNNFIADPDKHVHLLCASLAIVNGKEHAIDFSRVFNPPGVIQKEVGLLFRQVLYRELTKRLDKYGIELETYDREQGFFRVKGFSEEIEKAYSHREQEILDYAEENRTNTRDAVMPSRSSKDKNRAEVIEIQNNVFNEIFTGENAVNFISHEPYKEEKRHERREPGEERSLGDGREIFDSGRGRTVSDAPNLSEEISRGADRFLSRQVNSLRDVCSRTVDGDEGLDGPVSEHSRAEGAFESDLLVSPRQLDYLAELQARTVRSDYLRKTHAAEGRDRINQIDKITKAVISDMTETEYSMALPELRRRIRAYDLGMDLSDREITRAINRAGLIEMGRRIVDGKPTRDRYVTTKEILAIEPWLEQHIHDGKGKMKHGIMSKTRARALLKYVETAPYQIMHDVPKDNIFRIEVDENGKRAEQGEAVINILSSNDRYTSVVGLAGTGKTTLMQRLNWICQESDINVRGLAFTGKAAAGLQNESGIQSSTIHAFLNRIEKQSKERWKPDELKRVENSPVAHAVQAIADKFQNDANRDTEKQIQQDWDLSQVKSDHGNKREIWVIDEAGLVDMKLMKYVMEAAEKCNAQIVFSGDPDQLPPVGKGEAFRWMIEKYGIDFVRLTHIMRQRKAEEYEQESVRESVLGDPRKSLKLMEEHGDLREFSSTAERRKAIISEVTDNATLADYKDTLLLVSTNADRKMYNKRIRDVFVQRGEIEEGKEYTILSKSGKKRVEEKRHFAVGDRIIFGANKESKGFSVKNGEMGRIVAINGNKFTVEIDGDTPRKVTFDITKYKDVDHAYAVTLYKSQGMTVKRVVVDFDTQHGKRTRNELYVAISRMKLHAICFTDNLKRLAQETQKFAVKVNAEAHERGKALLEHGVTEKDIYKAHEGAEEEKLARRLRDIAKTTGRPISQTKGSYKMAKPPGIENESDIAKEDREPTAYEKSVAEYGAKLEEASRELPAVEWGKPVQSVERTAANLRAAVGANKLDREFIYMSTRAELLASGKISLDMEHDPGYMEQKAKADASLEVMKEAISKRDALHQKLEQTRHALDASVLEDGNHPSSIFSVLSKNHYESKTPQLQKDVARLEKDLAKAEERAENAKKMESVERGNLSKYRKTFVAKLDKAVRDHEPMIREYDQQIKRDEKAIQKEESPKREKSVPKKKRTTLQKTHFFHGLDLSKPLEQSLAKDAERAKSIAAGIDVNAEQEASQSKTREEPAREQKNVQTERHASKYNGYESAVQGQEYMAPYEPIENAKSADYDKVINANRTSRAEIITNVKRELIKTPEFDLKHDETYAELQAELTEAYKEAAKAGKEYKDASDERTEISATIQKHEAQLEKSRAKDEENAQKPIYSFSKYKYHSKTAEMEDYINGEKKTEASAIKKESAAKEKSDKANERVEALKAKVAAYNKQREARLQNAVYKKAPILYTYDKTISKQTSRAQELRKQEREAARAAEREQSRDRGHSF